MVSWGAGSKVQANASKHKAMSYGRMKEEEKRLAAEIEALLFRADETDRREDEQYGRGQHADALPGYLSERNIAYCDANEVDAYVAVGGKTPDGAELGRLPMTPAQEVRWQ